MKGGPELNPPAVPLPAMDFGQLGDVSPSDVAPIEHDASETNLVLKAGLALALAAGATAVASFFKEVAVARRFGAGAELDGYLVAYTCVTFAPAVVGFVLQSTLIPTLASQFQRGGISTWRFVSALAAVMTFALAGISLSILAFAPALVHAVSPGFAPEEQRNVVRLMIELLPLVWTMTAASFLIAILNSLRRFALPAATQILPSLFAIVGLLEFSDRYGISALAAGWVLGSLAQLVILVGASARSGARTSVPDGAGFRDVGEFTKLSVPYGVVALLPASLLVIDQRFASTLGSGAISALNYADKLFRLPLTILITALYSSVHPFLSTAAARGDMTKFGEILRRQLLLTAMVLLPVGLSLSLLADTIVGLIYKRGAFGAGAAESTVAVLFYLGLNVPVLGVWFISDRALTSLRRTGTLMLLAIFGIAFKLGAAAALVGYLGIGGLALATVLTFLVGSAGMYAILNAHLRSSGGATSAGRLLLALFAAAALAFGAVDLIWVKMPNLHHSYPAAALACLAGCSLYAVLGLLVGNYVDRDGLGDALGGLRLALGRLPRAR